MSPKKPQKNNSRVFEDAAERLAEIFIAILDENNSSKTTPEVPGQAISDESG